MRFTSYVVAYVLAVCFVFVMGKSRAHSNEKFERMEKRPKT